MRTRRQWYAFRRQRPESKKNGLRGKKPRKSKQKRQVQGKKERNRPKGSSACDEWERKERQESVWGCEPKKEPWGRGGKTRSFARAWQETPWRKSGRLATHGCRGEKKRIQAEKGHLACHVNQGQWKKGPCGLPGKNRRIFTFARRDGKKNQNAAKKAKPSKRKSIKKKRW